MSDSFKAYQGLLFLCASTNKDPEYFVFSPERGRVVTVGECFNDALEKLDGEKILSITEKQAKELSVTTIYQWKKIYNSFQFKQEKKERVRGMSKKLYINEECKKDKAFSDCLKDGDSCFDCEFCMDSQTSMIGCQAGGKVSGKYCEKGYWKDEV